MFHVNPTCHPLTKKRWMWKCAGPKMCGSENYYMLLVLDWYGGIQTTPYDYR